MSSAQPNLSVDLADAFARVPANSTVRSRPLLLLERTMYREGRTPFTSVFTVKLQGSLNEEHLPRALLTLQAKHPLLRCVVEHAGDRPHFVLQDSPAPIPLRIVERRGEDDWQDQVRREWTIPFCAGHEPLARFVWLRGVHASELILLAHHCLCDGQSGMTLLEECLRACDDSETAPLEALKTVEDLVPACIRQDRHFQRRVRWKMRLLRLALLFKRKKPVNTRLPIAHNASAQMYFQRWRLDEQTSLSIMDRCKTEGVTILAAATVAFLQAFREVRGTSELRKAYTMVNVRRFLPQLKPDTLFGIAPGVQLSLKAVPDGEMTEAAFWRCSRAIKTDMNRRIDRLGAGLYEYLVGLESLHDKYERLVGDTEGAPTVRHVTLSNMGRLDLPTQYRTFAVETVYSPLVMVSPTPANTVILSSFAGRLEFAIVSDTQSLPKTQATAIRQRAMFILRSCAGMADSVAPATFNVEANLTGAETK
jgi:NRPS condensation-like uncharacterized protein